LHKCIQTRGIPVGLLRIAFEACSSHIREQAFYRNTSIAGIGHQ
jgi:hypothetical protein